MRKFILATATAALLLPQLAFALSLDQAKAQGLVGETPSGYIAAVKASSEVNALVADINSRRRVAYEASAKQTGAPRSAVEAIAAQKAYEKTPAGQYVQGADGSWKKK